LISRRGSVINRGGGPEHGDRLAACRKLQALTTTEIGEEIGMGSRMPKKSVPSFRRSRFRPLSSRMVQYLVSRPFPRAPEDYLVSTFPGPIHVADLEISGMFREELVESLLQISGQVVRRRTWCVWALLLQGVQQTPGHRFVAVSLSQAPNLGALLANV